MSSDQIRLDLFELCVGCRVDGIAEVKLLNAGTSKPIQPISESRTLPDIHQGMRLR